MSLGVIDFGIGLGSFWTTYSCSECQRQCTLSPEDDNSKCPYCEAPDLGQQIENTVPDAGVSPDA